MLARSYSFFEGLETASVFTFLAAPGVFFLVAIRPPMVLVLRSRTLGRIARELGRSPIQGFGTRTINVYGRDLVPEGCSPRFGTVNAAFGSPTSYNSLGRCANSEVVSFQSFYVFISACRPRLRLTCHGDVCVANRPTIRAGVGGMLING